MKVYRDKLEKATDILWEQIVAHDSVEDRKEVISIYLEAFFMKAFKEGQTTEPKDEIDG